MAPRGESGGRQERPEYTVYRAGGGRGAPRSGSASRSSRGEKERRERPEYTVYRSRRLPDLSGLRERLRRGKRPEPAPGEPSERPTWRRVLRWALIAAGAWILLSVVLFVVSAQLQQSKLNDAAADELGGSPLLLAAGQTILVIGTDARPEGTNEAGAETRERCLEGAAHGDPPADGCGGFRADTLMLVRAGGGSFEKLSIPRDAFAAIPGHTPQKINAAYALGGAALQLQTVEDFLGIDIDHAVILDFEGFADFIDAIGGVEVDLTERVKSKINGGSSNGGITLKLDRGEHTLDGQQALALARTRINLRNPGEDDLDRARRQQQILSGIQSRLTSIWRLPINFIRGPLIAWNAPRAMVSDMGGLTMPQLPLAAALGGDSRTRILTPSAAGPDGSLIISLSQCERQVRRFLGEDPPRTPACSPVG